MTPSTAPGPRRKLFLLDAYALIYRAYYALMRSPRFTSRGLNTSAIFGFVNTLDEVLRKENPSHIAVCFDPPGPTFRHEAFEAYKAQREKQPEDITLAVPWIKRIIAAHNIPVVEVAGYEADDVIGTLSRMAAEEGFDTYMMTPDKDYGQLVTEHVWMYRPSLKGQGFEIRGPKEVCERYGIERPEQVIDLLALEGDSSDNIPGCPGVGEKTAKMLISIWGSVENLLAHADQVPGATGRKVRDNADQIRQSKMLATIRTDVPVDIDVDGLVRRPENVSELATIYRELEFRTFLKRLGPVPDVPAAEDAPRREGEMGSLFDADGEPIAQDGAPAGRTLKDVPHNFRLVTTVAEAGEIVARLAGEDSIGLEAYAVGAEAMTARLRGIALAAANGDGWYVQVPEGTEARAAMMAVLEPLIGQGTVEVVAHDVKRAYLLLKREGIEWGTRYFDISVAHYVLEPEKAHRLPAIAATEEGYLTVDIDDAPRQQRREKAMTAEEAVTLFCEGALTALRLRGHLARRLDEADQTALYTDIELPLVRVLAEMEWTGVRIDTAELAKLSKVYTRRLNDLEKRAYELAGRPFNTGSPSQVGEILFGEMKIDPKAKKTKKGAYSTTEEILEKYRRDVPLVDVILEIRGVRKLLATYIDSLPTLVNPLTGKIHTTYNQTVTATGRISSTNPNLQNIPIRSDDGREIRRAFIADPGCLFMSADYSQIELRLIADISADKDMVEAFLSGEDIHRATAAKIFGKPLEKVTDNERRTAKTANFGIIYGISAFGLSERLGIPRGEAKEIIDGYFASYPHIRDYIDRSIANAREHGYVATIKGRKRYLPDINSRNATVRSYAERNAVNAPIQGSAADIIKIAMINVYRRLEAEGLRSRMIMQVHDELIFNVVPDELPTLQRIVTECMEQAYTGRVPLEVASGVGANWLEAH
ncbi:MAG: DNA polymerase I [Candidatus Amulumruptor caecigallinarius]|nr:DNA polymerase I [Candidatus Amulumruptor caecigallinarius]MCM1396952.1 DNA polymerase I [Candidatus Amulumruptor caecigallinarius]MCM1454767.1 DNA polymerase I [bacterium]